MADRKCSKFCVMSFGLALGIFWALCVFLMGLVVMLSNYGATFVSAMGAFYIGYTATFLGAFIGAVWAFLDGFICGVVFSWLYNVFCGCCGKCCKCE